MKNFSIKSIGLTLFLLCALAPLSYAGHDVVYLCQGNVYSWNLSDYASPNDTVVYASGPNDWTIFYDNVQYDTAIGNIIQVSPLQDRLYKVVSINGDTVSGCPIYLTVYVRVAPTISIPQNLVRHVTCPDGWTYPYKDGAFHVDLDDSVQNYAWITISNDSTLFSDQVYDSTTLTNLRSGMYYVTAHGINGCDYTDSVVIEQPEAWYMNYDSLRIDTVCLGATGCVSIGICGGTPPYNFTWFYFEYTENGLDTVFLEDTTRMVCGLLGGGKVYDTFMYDSRGCKAWGEEVFSIFTYLYEYVEDSTHIITTDPIACYGGDFLVQAQSIGEGTYTWYVGDVVDSVNYWTSIYGDSMFVADYYAPEITEPTWVYAEFSDQHGCKTRDSVFVQVSHPEIANEIPSHLCANGNFPLNLDLYTEATPPGGFMSYSGDGLSGYDQFSPTSSGTYTIFMNYTDAIGCTAGDTAVIQVVEPEPLVLEVDTLMFTDSLYHVDVSLGGFLLINGVVIGETGGQCIIDPGQFAPGYYTLHYEVILGEYGCLSEYDVTVHVVDRTSIKEFDMEVSVYPNPATSVLTLSSSEIMDVEISVTDIMGRLIRKERIFDTHHTLDVSDLPSGVYMLRLVSDTGASKTVKFVKR